MKKHTCSGLRHALEMIEDVRDAGLYVVPLFDQKIITGCLLGCEDIKFGHTIHGLIIPIKYCPFCGFKYERY